MNRRKFLGTLGLAAAAVAVAPSAIKLLEPVCVAPTPTVGYMTYIVGKEAIISEWASYTNFSQFAIVQSFDEGIQATAEELGRAASLEISRLYETVVSCGA